MPWHRRFATALLALLAFAIPIEHKFDKPLRHFSMTLIPDGLVLEGFEKKIYYYASDFAAIALFLFALLAIRVPFRRLCVEKGAVFLWIVFAFALASICASPMYNYPVVYTRLFPLLTAILLFSYLAHSAIKTNLVFSAFSAAAILQSGIAIVQYFKQAPLGLRILNEPKIATGAFSMSDGSRWIFDSIFGSAGPSAIIRSCGTFIHCNVLGSFLALSLIASYSLIASSPHRWIRRFLGVFLIVGFFALSTTYSRSAMFGWTLGTLMWFGYAIGKNGARAIYYDRKIRFLASMILAAVCISFSLLFNQYLNRGGIVNYNGLSRSSDAVRLKAQNVAFKMIEDHPLLGVGYQQYVQGARAYLPAGEQPHVTHNIYLLLASETGLLSLTSFLCFIALLFFRGVRSSYSPQIASLLGIFTAFLFIGCCDFTPILLQPGRLMFFCTAGLLAAEGRWRREQRLSLITG